MAGSNEANEANEANAGSLGRSGGGYGLLPDRVDLPFVDYDGVGTLRLTGVVTSWPDRDWSGDWGAWRILADFASAATPLYRGNTPPTGPVPGSPPVGVLHAAPDPANQGNGRVNPDGAKPVRAGAQYGRYVAACTAEISGGGTFALRDPANNLLETETLAGGVASFTQQLAFRIRAGTDDFKIGDRFVLEVVPPCWVAPYPDTSAAVEAELQELIRAAEDERADALGEIVAQSDSFLGYFTALTATSPRSHPKTCALMQAAVLVGTYVSMHSKAVYNRPRPSQLAPGLLPPLPIPGHPSYPSGHATQSSLVARCLRAALPSAPNYGQLGDAAMRLARRIARNREIAGLHYPSDSDAGRQLAADTLAFLLSDTMPSTRFKDLVNAARAEWT